MVSSAAIPPGATVAGAPFVLRTPSLATAPGVTMAAPIANANYRPVVMRPAGVITAGPPTVISSPGLTRMPTAAVGSMRPVFIGTYSSLSLSLSIKGEGGIGFLGIRPLGPIDLAYLAPYKDCEFFGTMAELFVYASLHSPFF